MRLSRSNMFSSAAASLASAAGLLMLTMIPSPAQADITCTQVGTDTFHIGSTIKFQWADTQTVQIDTFNLDLYCVQNNQLVQTITTLNQTSPSPVAWVVGSSLSALSTGCSLNQFQGAFGWTYDDPDTGETVAGQSKCKVMLLIDGGSTSTSSGSDPSGTDDAQSGDIVISDRTKSIVIGVGCAVGALVLAGIIGFYYIRYKNRRAVEKQMSKKLREPIQSGPLFPPTDRPTGGGLGVNGAGSRYNELASVTTASVSAGSPATYAARTEMMELGVTNRAASPALGSTSPTPIAAAHAKLNGGDAATSSASSMMGYERPGSLLTSSFVPMDDSSRSSSPHKNPFEQRENVQHQRQYEQELQLQQQHQQQQQQQQQQNYGSYPY